MGSVNARGSVLIQLAAGGLLGTLAYFVLPLVGVSAVSNTYVYWGTTDPDPVCEPWTGHSWQISGWGVCWHKDEPGTDPWTGGPGYYSAIDYNNYPWDGSADAGTTVRQYTIANYQWLWQYADVPDWWLNCKGVAAKAYFQDPYTGNWVYTGDFHYLHIDVYSGIDGLWTFATVKNIGTVASTDYCYSTAPHLHQSANVAWWTWIYSNTSRFNGYYDLAWQHRIVAPY